MKLSDYVFEFLAERGLKHVFLLPGGGCMHLADSAGKRKDMEFVCCLHEQTCALAAEAYAEFSNDLACSLVTAGPGGTNTITGVACAWIEGAPVLFISGQAKRADLISSRPLPVRSMGPQEVDIVSVVKPITKFATRVMDPSTIRAILGEAVATACHGRKGPVWIDIPLDVQAAQVEPSTLTAYTLPAPANAVDASLVETLARTLSDSRRPVLFAGNGVRTSGQGERFAQLVSKYQIPTLLTWKASDLLPENEPAFLGRPGGMGQRASNFTQQKADVILVMGARLDLPSVAFSHDGFAPKAKRIFVDVDPAELAKIAERPGDIKVETDLALFLPALEKAIASLAAPECAEWLSLCRSWLTRFPVILPEYRTQPVGYVSTYALMDVLSDQAKTDDVLVPGSSGPCSDIFYQAFRVKEGQRILNAPGLGAMGTGLPGTIGACLASGGRRVINVNGDGGFQLNIQDLETVRRLQLPIKYFILDNGGYRSIVAMQRNHFKGHLVGSEPSSGLTLPDIAAVARAYGLPVVSVDDFSGVEAAVRTTLETPGPALCVVKASNDEITAPRATSEVKPDGSIVSRPMEDMAPLLDRAEFAAIMAE